MLRTVARFLGLPFLSRALGLVVMAGGFVQFCYDGARSIANNAPRITTVSDLLLALPKERAAAIQGAIEGNAPWVWQALVAPLSIVPAALFALVLGAVFVWLGQPPREPIGFLTRP